jgi:hypothetical protein
MTRNTFLSGLHDHTLAVGFTLAAKGAGTMADVMCRCGYMASEHNGDECPGDGYGMFGNKEAGTMAEELAAKEASMDFSKVNWKEVVEERYNSELERLTQEVASLRAQVDALTKERDAAREALKPFAETFDAWLDRQSIDVGFVHWLMLYLQTVKTVYPRQWWDTAHSVYYSEE